MSTQIKISPMILKSFATLYPNPYMALHEFTSNAFDQSECFFNQDINAYNKPIEIVITIDGKTYDYARIIIHDNTTGIKDLSNLVGRIGNSVKINDDKVSGCFGVGMFSFLAICNKMIITTRLSNSDEIKRIELNVKMFESSDSENTNIVEERSPISGYKLAEKREDCWTRIILEDFHKQAFKEISAINLKNEIEKHFELILKRKNISVKIIDKNKSKEYICEAFDYSKYEGEEFKRELNEIEKYKSKKLKSKDVITLQNKITIFLKVTKARMLDRKPVFIIKGRRICEISDVKAFRTYSKNSIWSHPNITGYIDVTGILQPKISRDDFRPDDNGKALFHTLQSLENEIKEFITSQLDLASSNEYRSLESILSDTLKRLSQKTRFHSLIKFESGTKWHSEKGKGLDSITEKININAPVKSNDSGNNFTKYPDAIEMQRENIKSSYTSFDSDKAASSKEILLKKVEVELIHKARRNPDIKKAGNNSNRLRDKIGGINIVIDCEHDPPLDVKGRKIRSSLFDNRIIIYKKHPMFEERTKNSKLGGQIIGSDLIFYISTEIITQIYTMIYNESESNIKEMSSFFSDYSEGVHIFAGELSKLEGKSIKKLTK